MREEFPIPIRRAIAERAAYWCSRPTCRRLTVGPHSEQEKSVKSGVAAHIRAASPGGPRFDPAQTEEERTSITNAIWLCHACSDIVDKDPIAFPAQLLLEWKAQHDLFVAEGGGAIVLPEIDISTLGGLTLPDVPATLTGEMIAACREHVLTIRNPMGRLMKFVTGRIQFPEPVLRATYHTPPGSSARCKPDRMQFIAAASPGSSIQVGQPRPPLDLTLEIDTVPPRSSVVIHLLSRDIPDFPGRGEAFEHGAIAHYIRGEFQVAVAEEFVTRRFIVAMKFDSATRRIVSEPCVEDDGTHVIVTRSQLW